MSMKNGVWHDAYLDPPPDNALALGVRRFGMTKDYCFARYDVDRSCWIVVSDIGRFKADDDEMLFWMPLPKIPTIGDNVIIETKWIKRQEVDP